MKIIIVGGGKVGFTLCEQLGAEGHNITLLDTSPAIVEQAVNTFDIQGVVGSGTSYKAQIEAGIASADVLIAVTDNDETSLLSCLIAKKAGNCKTIARVRDPEYYSEIRFIQEELGLAMAINPDITVANEIERLIQIPSALEVDTFAKGRTTIIRIQIPEKSPLDNMEIFELRSKISDKMLVCIVEHGEEIIIPKGTTKLYTGDYISVVLPLYETRPILKKIGIEAKPVKSTMIAGGGKIAYYLAEKLIRAKQLVKIIEKDPVRCQELSISLPKAMILCGDASDEELLEEEGINEVDAFVSLTNFDEGNVLTSLYANEASKAKIITKISRISFEKILANLPIGIPVFSKYITAEKIIRYVRAMSNSEHLDEILTLYKMLGGKAEALELRVKKLPSTQDIVSVPIMNLKIRKDVILGCITRKGKMIIPKGSDTLEIGDTVVVVTTATDTNKISSLADIFEKGH
ncbi:MAG: Trk system potassium transporter TrkA [Clostridia bacterium]|nr:Trk system potassium transporter TrkA [Clostridia bacterium]